MALQSPAGLSSPPSSLQLNPPAPAASTQQRIYWLALELGNSLNWLHFQGSVILPLRRWWHSNLCWLGAEPPGVDSRAIKAKDRSLSEIIASRYPESLYKSPVSFHRSSPPVALLWGASVKQQDIPKQCQQWDKSLLSFSWFVSPVLPKILFNHYFLLLFLRVEMIGWLSFSHVQSSLMSTWTLVGLFHSVVGFVFLFFGCSSLCHFPQWIWDLSLDIFWLNAAGSQ